LNKSKIKKINNFTVSQQQQKQSSAQQTKQPQPASSTSAAAAVSINTCASSLGILKKYRKYWVY
jgi:hypothetical protein